MPRGQTSANYRCRICGSLAVAWRLEKIGKEEEPRNLYYCNRCFDALINLSCETCGLRGLAADAAPNTDWQKG